MAGWGKGVRESSQLAVGSQGEGSCQPALRSPGSREPERLPRFYGGICGTQEGGQFGAVASCQGPVVSWRLGSLHEQVIRCRRFIDGVTHGGPAGRDMDPRP